MKALSVIIVTYNSEKDIFDCLNSLFAHNDIGNALEVIVVDNNSTHFDAMQQAITKQYKDSVTILRNTQNGGYGQGNNIGIKHASAPIIMIMNPDVRLQRISLKSIVEQYDTDKLLAILGFRQIINEAGKRGVSFSLLNHYHGIIRLIGGVLAKRLDCFLWRRMYFSGACFCVRKTIFEGAGLFDEHIFLYGEENDIHYRIHTSFPNTHDRYRRDIVYLHLIENRPTTANAYQQRIASNEYVMHKQGRKQGTYIHSEEQRLKWAKLLFRNA